MRGIFFDEDDARRWRPGSGADGFEATAERERLAGEDDDEDHPWAVVTDAPRSRARAAVERVRRLARRRGHRRRPPEPRRRRSTCRPHRDVVTGLSKTEAMPETSSSSGCCWSTPTPTTRRINNGATMATLRRGGARRHPRDLHRRRDGRGAGPRPRPPRLRPGGRARARTASSELAEAMTILGVTDQRWLGGFGDASTTPGWRGTRTATRSPPTFVPDNAFWNADLTEAADHLVG